MRDPSKVTPKKNKMKTKNFTIESETVPAVGVIATFQGNTTQWREAHVFKTEDDCVAALCKWGALDAVIFVVPSPVRFEGSKRWEANAACIVQKGHFPDRSENLVRKYVHQAVVDVATAVEKGVLA